MPDVKADGQVPLLEECLVLGLSMLAATVSVCIEEVWWWLVVFVVSGHKAGGKRLKSCGTLR